MEQVKIICWSPAQADGPFCIDRAVGGHTAIPSSGSNTPTSCSSSDSSCCRPEDEEEQFIGFDEMVLLQGTIANAMRWPHQQQEEEEVQRQQGWWKAGCSSGIKPSPVSAHEQQQQQQQCGWPMKQQQQQQQLGCSRSGSPALPHPARACTPPLVLVRSSSASRLVWPASPSCLETEEEQGGGLLCWWEAAENQEDDLLGFLDDDEQQLMGLGGVGGGPGATLWQEADGDIQQGGMPMEGAVLLATAA